MSGEPKHKELSKHERWLKFFFDDSNGKTFLNATASAKAAGYNGSGDNSFAVMGCAQLRKVKEQLVTWLTDEGWTEDRIRLKFLQLMEAKKTERFAHQGRVIEEHEDEDRGIQIQAAKFAAKLLKMEPANKHEHSGPGGQQLEVTVKADMTVDEATAEYFKHIRE